MKLTIDNLRGLGAVDYSEALDRATSNGAGAAVLKRVLNAPSTFAATLCLEGTSLAPPERRARVVVASDAGVVLFTGFLTTEPMAVYAGMASAGPVYRLRLHAESDEWLLDQAAGAMAGGAAYGASGGAALAALLARASAGGLAAGQFVTAPVPAGARALGAFAPGAAAAFSVQAGAIASAAYGSYRVLGGSLSLGQVPGTQHTFSDEDGTLDPAALALAMPRAPANDVTVSGATEATTYWTEVFSGDGYDSAFVLTGAPAEASGGKQTLIDDSFAGETIDPATWAVTDAGAHLTLGPGGLALNGGNGLDGQVTLLAQTPLEVAGTVLLELGSVQLSAGSAGVLAGLYNGAAMLGNCTAGFHVRQSGGQTLLFPLIESAETGSSFALEDGHSYTLRVRLHCAEMTRVRQVFYGRSASGAVAEFGGGLVDAPMRVVLEVRDQGESSNTPVTVLYDGTIPVSPALVQVAPLNSLSLTGSIGSVRMTRTGSAWLQRTDPASGAVRTGLIGAANEGVDCELSSFVTGTVTFFPGRVPAVGEMISVAYRGRARAVGRVADTGSIAAEAARGGAGTARWLGRVAQPPARTSEDCESAALAIVSAAAIRAAAAQGTYATVFTDGVAEGTDIWPGDTLLLSANGATNSVIVRQLEIEDRGAAPEALLCRLTFANDWAEELGLKLTEGLAADALPPAAALALVPGPGVGDIPTLPGNTGGSLLNLTVAAVTRDAVQVDAGAEAPPGGGFEVRRRDGGFGSGLGTAATRPGNGDLVLRSPVRGFAIPRGAFEEHFFIRMYDGSTPPVYSRCSSAIVTHIAVS